MEKVMYHIIINPKAGKGKSLKALRLTEEKFKEKGIEYAVMRTEGPRHAIRLAREAAESGATDIVAMGGDGTLNEVLNGIPDPSAVRIGLIPCGTGNDFAVSAGISRNIPEAIDQLIGCKARPTDYMQMDAGVRGINIIGTGIDVDVLDRCRRSKVLRGKVQYAVSLIVSLVKFEFYRFTAKYNGHENRHEALIACVGNGRQFGGGIPICPTAEIDDGLMDCMIAGRMKKIAIPAAFVSLMRGNILKKKFTSMERTTRLEVEPETRMTVQVDGELYDDLPFRVTLVPGGLKFYRP